MFDNKILILLILILIVVLFMLNNNEHLETTPPLSNEAIQNIASVYNNQNMKVSNIETTGNINTRGDINISGNVVTNNLTSGSINISGSTISSTASAPYFLKNSMICNPGGRYCLGVNTTNSPIYGYGIYMYDTNSDGRGTWAQIPMNMNDSILTAPGWNSSSIVLDAPSWSTAAFVEQIKSGGYFKQNMQDGTRINFMFVYPNKQAGNTHLWNGVAVKMGKQFILYQISPDHLNVGNVFENQSNNLTWRGNI